jgi:hypothetical protein
MVAGVREGAGARDVECVCERAERDLSKNSTIIYGPPMHLYVHATNGLSIPLTLVSVNAL